MTTTKKHTEIKVNKGQRLSEVNQLFPLPSNAIIHKRLPGLGATYGEIIAPRNSIIVLPNRPVIEAKVAKHNNECRSSERILGIYKGIKPQMITDYVLDDSVTYKKILTTPEGYKDKLKVVLEEVWTDVKQNYYLLIDECERTIQDGDYRAKISAPFEDFFDFKNNGLISATTLPFSDPRFETLDHYVVTPTFDYQKPLRLIATNNVLAAFRKHIASNSSENYYIFCSSVSTIAALIDALEIKTQSKVHCSETRATSLRIRGYKTSPHLDVQKLEKYNFFTSRFYSGLDIELDYKADVLMLTEVLFAEHSILDPLTEVIQIVGRFRNGTNSITHISNFNSDIRVMSGDECMLYLQGQQDAYKQILKLRNEATSIGASEAYKEIIDSTLFTRYFYANGTFNYFMVDNLIQEQRVLGLYRSVDELYSCYQEIDDHFDVTIIRWDFPINDSDRLKRQSVANRKDEYKVVVDQLYRLESRLDNYVLGGDELKTELIRAYPVIAKAFYTIGRVAIVECQYREPCIKLKLEQHEKDEEGKRLFSPAVLKAVYQKFSIDPARRANEYTEMYIETTLQDIYDWHNIKKKARPGHILRYFEGVRTTRGSGSNKIYVLHKRKFENL